jgi:hypothetical protein
MLLLGVPSCPRGFLVRRLAARKGVGGSRNDGGLCRLVFQTCPSIVCIADHCTDTDYLKGFFTHCILLNTIPNTGWDSEMSLVSPYDNL